MSAVEKCIKDIIIQNWVLYSGCTYLELGFEFWMYISRIVIFFSSILNGNNCLRGEMRTEEWQDDATRCVLCENEGDSGGGDCCAKAKGCCDWVQISPLT